MPQDMRDTLVLCEHINLQGLNGMSPRLVSRRDENMAGSGRQMRLQVLRVVCIIEDQQPPARGVTTQFFHRSRCRLRGAFADFQAHLAGQSRQRQADLLGLVRRHPPDKVVFGHEPVRVLLRDLRFSGASQPVQG